LSSLAPHEAATLLREAVAALSRQMPVDPGTLVPAASTERLARLADKLERSDGAATPDVGAEDVAALDAWIRVADGFTLHPDAREVRSRADLGVRLRAVRVLIAPGSERLTTDPRDA
jgi:hypothetical protein